MGGLALGSFVGGKIIDRDFNPLAAYAILEAGIGIYCLLIPLFIELAFPLFQWIYLNLGDSYTQTSLVRFLVCGVLLIIPATFMGATLPVLSKLVSRDENFIGKDVGKLYSINTFGAVLGALASAFVFMRFLGVQATISVAAAANICIALIIYFVFKPPLKERLSYLAPSSKEEKCLAAETGSIYTAEFCCFRVGGFGLPGSLDKNFVLVVGLFGICIQPHSCGIYFWVSAGYGNHLQSSK